MDTSLNQQKFEVNDHFKKLDGKRYCFGDGIEKKSDLATKCEKHWCPSSDDVSLLVFLSS